METNGLIVKDYPRLNWPYFSTKIPRAPMKSNFGVALRTPFRSVAGVDLQGDPQVVHTRFHSVHGPIYYAHRHFVRALHMFGSSSSLRGPCVLIRLVLCSTVIPAANIPK